MKIKGKFIWSVLILIFIGACSKNEKKYFAVEKGTFCVTLTETGELQAVNSKVVTMPSFSWDYGRPKIAALEKEGTLVNKGDIVGLIDTSGVVRLLGQKKADLEIAKADFQKLKVQHDSHKKRLQAELESAQAALRMAEIDTQRVKFESASNKEVARLQLDMAEIDYQKANKKIYHTNIIQAEELQIQEEKIKQIISAIKKAQRTIENFLLRAPAEGMIVYRQKRRNRTKVRVGDQLWMGEAILSLPDLSRMKVSTFVNESDIDKISIGNKVIIRLDAFPKKSFDGEITKVSRTCHKKESKSKIKVFDVELLLEGSAPILRPGMTVSCEILVAELENVLFVDNSYIHQEGEEYYLFVKNGSKSRKIKIKLGPRNNKAVVVYGEIKDGEKIIKK